MPSDPFRICKLPYDMCVLVTVTVVLLFGFSATSNAAPKSDIWERWTTHDANAITSMDHQIWDIFLKKYVTPGGNGVNRVAYKKVPIDDKKSLKHYITTLAGKPVSQFNKNEQLAYWVNLYNALTVQVILDAYPVSSIRDIDISPGLFSDGPWGKKLLEIEGEEISLNDIEHRILRPIWKDPRLHYALNCASLGCPNLGLNAVTAQNSEDYLNEAAHTFINHKRAISEHYGKLYASSIYDWFMEDFGDSEVSVLKHLRTYADASLLIILDGKKSISGYDYDWALNDAEPLKTKIKKRRGS